MQVSDEFTVVSRRIETLTNVLQRLGHRKPPTSRKENVPSLLRHFATLLTCGDRDDKDAKRVIAVTGSFEANHRIKVLVLTQNPSNKSSPKHMTLNRMEVGTKSFDEVVNGNPDPESLQHHIVDLFRALTTCDPENDNQYGALQRFVIARCYRKLRARFNQHDKLFDGQFFEAVQGWEPKENELETRWIDVPEWFGDLLPKNRNMPEQTLIVHGKKVFQWEFSDHTKWNWAEVLSLILFNLCNAFKAADDVRDKAKARRKRGWSIEKEWDAYGRIDAWIGCLFTYIQNPQNVVQTLLTQTSLGSYLAASQVKFPWKVQKNEETEEYAEIIQEEDESFGEYVLRSLRMIVAWRAAVYSLVKKFHESLQGIEVGVVELPYHAPNPLDIDEVKEEFIRLFPKATASLDVLEDNFPDDPEDFHGTTHAEAALMGLLAYFSSDRQGVNHGEVIVNQDDLQEIILPSTFDKTIAVGKKCCWCCDKLRQHLGEHLHSEFRLPGTHGIVFAWIPPRVGIDVSVLKALETDLWNELDLALRARLQPPLSQQSTGSSTIVTGDSIPPLPPIEFPKTIRP